jgi:hypothetical protein
VNEDDLYPEFYNYPECDNFVVADRLRIIEYIEIVRICTHEELIDRMENINRS